MTPERFREIEALYQSAREHGADVLATADPELRKVVESLLAQEHSDKSLGRSAAETQSMQTAVAVGSQLGPYKIEAVLGEGGMGQVFRALDTRLARGVAIKVSHEKFTERFEREARMIAALNHPHICTLYDVGPNYLVMELVDGETFAARLKKGKLSIDETLRYGAQIADALATAHARGITHRDLKPGNIMLTKSGVKVLDFGLAKSSRDHSLTATNVALGTPAYMAPEQFEAKDCDARTDIYALGLVLFEMATGRRLVPGDPAIVPDKPQFSHLVDRCLAKDPEDRWQAASDVRKELEWVRQAASAASSAVVTSPARSQVWLSIAVWIAAAVLLLGSTWLYLRAPATAQVLRSTVSLPGKSISLHSFAISPDGRYLAIAAQIGGKRQLWLRALDAFEAQPLPSTDEAMYPFWSPAGRSIGFFAEGKLKTIAINAGTAQTLCDAPFGRGGTWNRDDVIVFSPSGAKLQRISATGGKPTDLTTAEGGKKHPAFLPDGRHFLYLTFTTSGEQSGIYLGSLDGGENQRVLPDISGLVFAAGQILFIRENALVAQPLDMKTWQPKGGVIPVAAGVSKSTNLDYAPVTASDTGLLLYQTGGELAVSQFSKTDRKGNFLGAEGAPGRVNNPSLSPDDKWLAYTRPSATSVDLWLRNLARGTEQRLAADPNYINGMAFWAPHGDRLVFQSDRNGIEDLYQKTADGSMEELLFANKYIKIPSQWSHDGRFIVYTQNDPKTRRDIWVLPMDGPKRGEPRLFLHSEYNEYLGQLSPDSSWMAYSSDESGRPEVYVKQFPAGQGQLSISLNGGERPHWRADGKELFFVAADGKMMAVPIKFGADGSLQPGQPEALFDANLVRPPNEPLLDYDVYNDGQRFLLTTTAVGSGSAPMLNLVTNWVAALNK
jgi:serine/threonine protein kinase